MDGANGAGVMGTGVVGHICNVINLILPVNKTYHHHAARPSACCRLDPVHPPGAPELRNFTISNAHYLYLSNHFIMNATLSLRFADTEDINTIGYLAQQIWPSTYRNILPADQINYMMDLYYSPSSLKKQMKEDKHQFLLIEDGEGTLGFASYSRIKATGTFKLHKIYVLPALQGKGIGKAIIDFIVENIKPQG